MVAVRSQVISSRVKGLDTNSNPIIEPEGSFEVMENCVANRPGVVENRRGMYRYASSGGLVNSLGEFEDTLIALDGTTLKYDVAGTLTTLSFTASPPTGNRMRFLEEKKCLYFPSTTGIQRLDDLPGTVRSAGCPRGLDLTLALHSGVGTILPATKFMGYRLTWVIKDANNRPIESAPTPLYVIEGHVTDAKDIDITSSLPDGIQAGDVYRIYRTDYATTASAVGDTCFLVQEVTVVAGDLTAGYVSYADNRVIIDGSNLYTNPNEQTIDQANDPPPYAVDLATFKGITMYAGTKREHSLDLQLISMANLVIDTDSITIGTETYTPHASEDASLKYFQKFSTGDAADDVEKTTQSLCKIINLGSASYYATYFYNVNEEPGKFTIFGRTLATAQFSVTANDALAGACFTPTLPISGTTVSSTNDDNPNRLYYSKLEQPDAVPYLNYDDVGSENSSILRVIPLQDSVVIVKEVGLYRLSGDTVDSFSIKPLDPSIRCFAPDTWGVLNNQAVGLSDQGVVRADENGVAIISFPIDGTIREIFSIPNFQTICHGTHYPSERIYILWAPETATDTYAKVGWVYNFLVEGGQWSGPWRKNVGCTHLMRTEDKLYFAKADEYYVLKERKSFTTSFSDYSDESISVTLSGVTTTVDEDGYTVSQCTVTYGYALVTFGVGWVIVQGSDSACVETCTDNGDGTYLVVLSDHLSTLVAGAATVEMPVTSILRWRPETCNNPHVIKDFTFYQMMFEDDGALHHQYGFHHNVGFANNHLSDILYHAVRQDADRGWGLGLYGEGGWGDDDPSIQIAIRNTVPTNYRKCAALSLIYKHAYAREHFALLTMALTYRPLTDITVKVPR
jgi:hypothetical protein